MRPYRVLLLATAALALIAAAADARSLAALFDDPRLAGLELAPIGPHLANSVASTYPVASASSSVLYAYDPETGTFERKSGGVGGPIFGERAETIGRGQFNLGISWSWVHLTTINGDDLDSLVNRPVVKGRVISFPVPDGVTLADGRFTSFLPVRVVADIGVDAQIATPSVTYGVTPDLDVNVTLPVVWTSLRVSADTLAPDPRIPEFALPPGDPHVTSDTRTLSEHSAGVGDLLLRAKYVLLRKQPVDLAAGLGVSLPTGDEENFQGTGHTHVAPTLVFSRIFADRVEPLLNVGIDFNADDVGRSVVRWAAGATVQVVRPLTAAVVFLGRHELAAQTDPIATPFFFQIERNDFYDAAVGFRWRFTDTGVLSANALVPLNRDGLRADVIPTVALEYAF